MRRLRRLPIGARAALAAAAMTAAVGLLASWLVLTALAETQRDRLAEVVRMHVDGLSLALGPAAQRRDIWEIYDTLDRAAATGDGRLALTVVADDRGLVLAASDPRRAPTDSALAALMDEAQPIDALGDPGLSARLRVLAPLAHQGRRVGDILTELDVADLVTERRRVTLALLIGNTIATASLTLASYLVVRRALRPLETLARRMGDADGAPTAIPLDEAPRSGGEIARLFRTYNGMVAAIADKADAGRRLAERERFVSLGRLASSLAHEINNPLGGLLAAADTLRSYADRPEVVRSSAGLIERGLSRLRDVAQAALDQHRIADDAAPMTPEDVDDMRLLIGAETGRLGQRLDWRVAAEPAALAQWPATRLRQIALNLLLNASAAAGRGGRLGLALTVGDGGLRLEVRDDGPGLGAAALARLTSAEAPPPGGGLGLRLVRELAIELGGSIEHARDGAETVVAVTLPGRPGTREA
ncbi:sensor histidine kinase [Rubrimonas cliftonensis]|uniref:histidine kinase n=1 Tax=Rubrimonas cliftonensis TaxID=89524 RepID=A0A1H4F1E5_9RHOB|nr:HAMP domain-containing sensor histidine kinase [Rubrimonas cliftonensis]SEA90807.1 Signal transduction histidine kinase [Rubrimonas cliftonensis]